MSESAFVAAILPQSPGSSTIGVKKSVVAISARPSPREYTAASSPVSLETISWGGGAAAGPSVPRTSRRVSGPILHAQPAPWLNSVSRIDSVRMLRGYRGTTSARPRRSKELPHVPIPFDVARRALRRGARRVWRRRQCHPGVAQRPAEGSGLCFGLGRADDPAPVDVRRGVPDPHRAVPYRSGGGA